MKLNNVIAAEITNRISDGMDVQDAVTSVMKQVPVQLGQKTKVPLADLVPNIILDDAVSQYTNTVPHLDIAVLKL